MRAAAALVLVLAGSLVAAATAAAPGPPPRGVVVEGKTFGGLALGLTPAQVEARWGRRHGLCDNCDTTTWYFTFVPFVARGVAVEFRQGRVDAYFTVGAPSWRTAKGLHVHDPAAA